MQNKVEQKCSELEAKIDILESENTMLADRAEEIILFSLVSESIAHLGVPEAVIDAVLERISILKAIPYCACFTLKGQDAQLLQAYASFRENGFADDRLELTQKIYRELSKGAVIDDFQPSEPEDDALYLLVDKFTPVSVALVPFVSRAIPTGVFVFADNDSQEQRLPHFIFLLQRVVEMTVAKLDNISLFDELVQLNAELDTKVEMRTAELAASESRFRKLNETLEKRVKDRTAKLEAANEEMEAFTYSVSHDLRAPLRAVDGYTRLMQHDYSDQLDEQGSYFLQQIRSGVHKMAQLIDDMLTLSRVSKQAIGIENIDLSGLAAQIIDELRHQHTERDVEFKVMPGCVASGDPGLIEVALYNLLENAWKFTGKEKLSRIEFGQISKQERPVYFVRDNGTGFDEAYKDKLFGLFQRLHHESEFPGTGVGLVIVKRIVQRHGGTIWADGSKGKGATFYFSL